MNISLETGKLRDTHSEGKVSRDALILDPIPESFIFGTDLGPKITANSARQTHFNRQLFAWSWLYYRDIFFPRTKPHVMELCNHLARIDLRIGSINSKPNQTSTFPFNFVWADCQTHNCDDERCADYQAIVNLAEKR
jgi:hypothetical protein